MDYDAQVYSLFGGREIYLKSITDLVGFAALPETAKVLELCCGTGLSTREILRFTRHVTAVELNPDRMEKARCSLPSEAKLLIKNALQLQPSLDGTYDAVLCINGFHYFEEPGRFYEVAHRMLRPSGRLVFNVKLHDYEGQRPLYFTFQKVFSRIANEVLKMENAGCSVGLIGDRGYLDSAYTLESCPQSSLFRKNEQRVNKVYYDSTAFLNYCDHWKDILFLVVGWRERPRGPPQYWNRQERWRDAVVEEKMEKHGVRRIPPEERIAKIELFIGAGKVG